MKKIVGFILYIFLVLNTIPSFSADKKDDTEPKNLHKYLVFINPKNAETSKIRNTMSKVINASTNPVKVEFVYINSNDTEIVEKIKKYKVTDIPTVLILTSNDIVIQGFYDIDSITTNNLISVQVTPKTAEVIAATQKGLPIILIFTSPEFDDYEANLSVPAEMMKIYNQTTSGINIEFFVVIVDVLDTQVQPLLNQCNIKNKDITATLILDANGSIGKQIDGPLDVQSLGQAFHSVILPFHNVSGCPFCSNLGVK